LSHELAARLQSLFHCKHNFLVTDGGGLQILADLKTPLPN
jgi:hypothetical protein